MCRGILPGLPRSLGDAPGVLLPALLPRPPLADAGESGARPASRFSSNASVILLVDDEAISSSKSMLLNGGDRLPAPAVDVPPLAPVPLPLAWGPAMPVVPLRRPRIAGLTQRTALGINGREVDDARTPERSKRKVADYCVPLCQDKCGIGFEQPQSTIRGSRCIARSSASS